MTRWNDQQEGLDDELARSVARCLFEDPSLEWTAAFAAARRILGLSVRGAMPSRALVRRHLEAIEEVRLGAEGARLARQARVQQIVELLEFVRFVLQPSEIFVVGLLAQGVVVGPQEAHVRILEGAALQVLYEELEGVGVREVVPSSMVGPMGRFESVQFDSDGVHFTLTRIAEEQHAQVSSRNLVTGAPIAQVTLKTLSQCFSEPS